MTTRSVPGPRATSLPVRLRRTALSAVGHPATDSECMLYADPASQDILLHAS